MSLVFSLKRNLLGSWLENKGLAISVPKTEGERMVFVPEFAYLIPPFSVEYPLI